jgi:hypothetical protein
MSGYALGNQQGIALPLLERIEQSGMSREREEKGMSSTNKASNTSTPTQFIQKKDQRYAFRRFGGGTAHPMLCLQHFTGTQVAAFLRSKSPFAPY